MLRLPKRLIDLDTVSRYCAGDCFSCREAGDNLILEFLSEEEDGDWGEGEGWLSSLIPLRAEILNGDLRSLYLGWLLCAQEELYYEDGEEEYDVHGGDYEAEDDEYEPGAGGSGRPG